MVKEDKSKVPDTGISGVYEVCMGTTNPAYAIKYFTEFGYHVIEEKTLSEKEALQIYGHSSALKSIRMQNGMIDSHGLLRLLVWESPLNEGVGFAPPRTIGQRLAVMKTDDIFRLMDVFNTIRENGDPCTITSPIADDLFDLDRGKKDFFNRPVIVRENAVYSKFFNHIFFQRYGYHIEGYGTVAEDTPLRTSEFTHHDFFISSTDMSDISYMSSALGFIAEDVPVLDGEWQKGPREVFMMKTGEAHWYQGFVSPNNICGKLKFLIPTTQTNDFSDRQKIGSLGITMHSFYTDKLEFVHKLVNQHQLSPSPIQNNEFMEQSFTFTGPGGCHWQIIQKENTVHTPITELKISVTKN